MRARRRPLAILVLWAWQVVLAAFVALPTTAAVAAWYGRNPTGDAPLWRPGALALADLVMGARAARRETFLLSGLVFLVAGFADLFPLAGLLAAIAYVTRELRAPPMRSVFAHASGIFTTLATLFAMSALAEGFLVIVALVASDAVATATQARLGDARADQTGWLVALAVLGIATTVGVLHDLARAGAVRFRVRALRSWRLAFNALARAPAAVLWSWAWRALAGWAPVAIGALVSARLGGRGGAQLVALFFVHQLVLAVRSRSAHRGSRRPCVRSTARTESLPRRRGSRAEVPTVTAEAEISITFE